MTKRPRILLISESPDIKEFQEVDKDAAVVSPVLSSSSPRRR